MKPGAFQAVIEEVESQVERAIESQNIGGSAFVLSEKMTRWLAEGTLNLLGGTSDEFKKAADLDDRLYNARVRIQEQAVSEITSMVTDKLEAVVQKAGATIRLSQEQKDEPPTFPRKM